MAVKPIDLQVNMQSVMETSRAQGIKQAAMAQEQRLIDTHNIEEAQKKGSQVNKTPESDASAKLKDAEDHFGNKTEAEMEQEYSKPRKKQKKKKKETEKDEEDQSGRINFLA